MTGGAPLEWRHRGDGNYGAIATVQGKVAIFEISQSGTENHSVCMVFPLGLATGTDSLENAKEMAQGFLDALGGTAGELVDYKD